jgi:hypothetical protein
MNIYSLLFFVTQNYIHFTFFNKNFFLFQLRSLCRTVGKDIYLIIINQSFVFEIFILLFISIYSKRLVSSTYQQHVFHHLLFVYVYIYDVNKINDARQYHGSFLFVRYLFFCISFPITAILPP